MGNKPSKGILIINKTKGDLVISYTHKDRTGDATYGDITVKAQSKVTFDKWRYDGIAFPNGKKTNTPHGLQDVYKIKISKDQAVYYGRSYSTAAHPLNKDLVRVDKFV
jgi:hypothetical protein